MALAPRRFLECPSRRSPRRPRDETRGASRSLTSFIPQGLSVYERGAPSSHACRHRSVLGWVPPPRMPAGTPPSSLYRQLHLPPLPRRGWRCSRQGILPRWNGSAGPICVWKGVPAGGRADAGGPHASSREGSIRAAPVATAETEETSSIPRPAARGRGKRYPRAEVGFSSTRFSRRRPPARSALRMVSWR